MERTKISVSDRNGYLRRLRDTGYEKDVIDLVSDDLEYGLTIEEVELYLKKKGNVRFKQIYSKCLREGLSDEVIAVIMRDGLDGSQMQVALEFYQKGVPIETIQSVMDKGENAKHMQKAFEGILANMEKSKEELQNSGLEKEYVEGLVKQLEEVVAKINHQEKRYDELNKKLSVFETARHDKEVHDNLIRKYNDSEAALNSQQEELSRATSTIARLREQIEDKKKEMERMQNRINDLEDKLVNMATSKVDDTVSQQVAGTETTVEANTAAKDDPVSKPAFHADNTTAVQPLGNERPLPQGAYQIPVYYQLPVIDANGRVVQHVQVERTIRKGNQGAFTGFLGKLGFMKKSRQDIVKLLASEDLVPAQLVQIRSAIEKGLTESQLVELINNNVSAEKMKEIIDIAVLENSMDY